MRYGDSTPTGVASSRARIAPSPTVRPSSRSPPRCTTGREGQPATRCIANGTRGTTSPKRFPERNTSDNLSWTSESVCQSAYGQRPVGLAIWAITAAEKLTALTTSVGRVRSRRSGFHTLLAPALDEDPIGDVGELPSLQYTSAPVCGDLERNILRLLSNVEESSHSTLN